MSELAIMRLLKMCMDLKTAHRIAHEMRVDRACSRSSHTTLRLFGFIVRRLFDVIDYKRINRALRHLIFD